MNLDGLLLGPFLLNPIQRPLVPSLGYPGVFASNDASSQNLDACRKISTILKESILFILQTAQIPKED